MIPVVILIVIAADLIVYFAFTRNRDSKGAAGLHLAAPLRYLRILINLAAFAAFAFIAATGLLTPDHEMTGDRLMWHVTSAPVFAVAAVAVTLIWAHRNRFSSNEGLRPALRTFFFWAAVALAVPTMVSILAAMYPIFGTDDQKSLVLIHRTCAELLTVAGLLFSYFALVTWRKRSSD